MQLEELISNLKTLLIDFSDDNGDIKEEDITNVWNNFEEKPKKYRKRIVLFSK